MSLETSTRHLEDALKKARELYGRKDLSNAETTELNGLVSRIVQLREDVTQAKAIKVALKDLPGAPNDEGAGFAATGGKSLADFMALRYQKAELESLHTALKAGSGFQIKAVQAEADLGPSGGTIIDLSQPNPALRDKVRLASMIPAKPAPDGGNQVTFYRNSAKAAGATAVAESGSKPQSSPEWEAITEPIRKIAHYAHIPDEAFEDYQGFAELLSNEMLAGLIDEENDQLLNGNGTTPNLAGILDRAIQTRAQGTDTDLDALLSAISDVREDAFVEPDAVLMSAAIYKRFRLLKNNEDEYILGDPSKPGTKSVDGVPIAISSAVPALTVVTGRFASLRAYVRSAPRLESTNSDGDDFVENKRKVRAEERLALAFPDGESVFCALTLNA